MSQQELAAGRCTKQYVSQIERGETTPSDELLDWLAGRLGVQPVQLRTGLSTADLARVERGLEGARELLDEHRYAEAVEVLRPLRRSLPAEAPRAARREAMRSETWALVRLGRVTEAAEVLAVGRADAEGAAATSEERAEIAYLTAICCYTLSQISAAQLEFARALRLLDETGEPSNQLRLDIHQWRSRCYRRQRDWEAAREDIDLALELCEATGDVRRSAEVNLQASLVAERQGRWVLARRLCGDLARPLPRRRRHGHGGACPQQPRRPEPLARQRRDRDRAAPGGVCDLRRREPRGGGRLRPQLACRDSPRAGRSRRGRGGGESRARPARGARRPHPGDRDGATRPRAGATRTGRARAGRGNARRRGCELRAHGVDQPPGALVDDPRGARAAAPQRCRGCPPVPRGGHGAAAARFLATAGPSPDRTSPERASLRHPNGGRRGRRDRRQLRKPDRARASSAGGSLPERTAA